MDYIILEAGDSHDLAEQVRHYLAQHYKVQGNLVIVPLVTSGERCFLYVQAMTRDTIGRMVAGIDAEQQPGVHAA